MNRTVDFSIHGIRRELVKLRDQDWVHVHITKRAMTIDGRTYSLQTNLSFESKLPNLYFGQDYCAEEVEDVENWNVLST